MTTRFVLGALCLSLLGAAPLAAQGKGPRHYAVTSDRALHVTRAVLGMHKIDVGAIEAAVRG